MKECLAQLLQNITEDLIAKCALEDLFGSRFTIAEWENNLSHLFGDILLFQNITKSARVSFFPGITMVFHRLDSEEDMDSAFLESRNNQKSSSIFFASGSRNQFLLDSQAITAVDGIQYPFALVSASFDHKIWMLSNLSTKAPAQLLENERYDDTLQANKEIRVLPVDQNVLSLSLFVRRSLVPTSSADSAVTKVSIPVQPRFDIGIGMEADDIYELDSLNGNSRIALYGIDYECAFLDENASSWSTSGCHVERQSDGLIDCNCEHTTTFGVLLAVRSFTIPEVVTTLITSLEIISILALVITVALLSWLKKSIHNDRTIIQINLAASLFFLHFFIVINDYARDRTASGACQFFAVVIHFFTLTTVFWMLNEGMVLYFKTYKNALSFDLKKIFPRLAAVAWGFPLIFVSICAGVGLSMDVYLDKLTSIETFPNVTLNSSDEVFAICYVGFRSGMIFTVAVPVGVIVIITTAIIIKTSIKINAMSSELANMRPSGKISREVSKQDSHPDTHDKKRRKTSYNIMNARKKLIKQASTTLRTLILLLPVLGITWFLGFLVNIPRAEVSFVIIYGVINGLQGVFIFYIYCVKNSQFRRVFGRKWKEISTNLIGTDAFQSNRMSMVASHNMSSNN